MGFFGNLFKSEFEKWVEGASHEELSEAYFAERFGSPLQCSVGAAPGRWTYRLGAC